MGLRISSFTSLFAANNLSEINRRINISTERLSSGLRINRASDDPAGLALSEQFRSQIRSYTQAQDNAQQGIALTRVADAGLQEISDSLIRMRELAIQASNGSLSSSQRSSAQSEFSDLAEEITRIANTTEFNNINPLNNSGLQVGIQVGIRAGANNEIAVSGVNATAATLGVNGLSVATSAQASAAIPALDSAIRTVGTLLGQFGATERRLESATRVLAAQIEGASLAESSIRDADIATETAELTRNLVLQQAGVAVLAQANASQAVILKLLSPLSSS